MEHNDFVLSMKRYAPNLISGALLIAALLMYWCQDRLLALTSAIAAFVTLGTIVIWRWYRARVQK